MRRGPRRVLADAAGEDQRVEPAQHGRERADPFPPDSRTARSPRRRATSSPRVRADRACRRSSRRRRGGPIPVEQVVESSRRHAARCAPRYRTTPGSRSPERVPIITPPVGVKPMRGVDAAASRTAARLAPLPRWARMTRPRAAFGAGDALELPHQIRVRQAVEAVAPHARASYAAGSAASGDARQSRGTPCRSTPPVAARGSAPTASTMPRSIAMRAAYVRGRRSSYRCQPSCIAASDLMPARSLESCSAVTTRCPTATSVSSAAARIDPLEQQLLPRPVRGRARLRHAGVPHALRELRRP